MLGNWASENLHRLSHDELLQFRKVLDQENPELFKWLTGQQPVPDEINSKVMQMLCGDVASAMQKNSTVRSAAGTWEGKVWE